MRSVENGSVENEDYGKYRRSMENKECRKFGAWYRVPNCERNLILQISYHQNANKLIIT